MLKISEVSKALNKRVNKDNETLIKRVVIDSRIVKKGDLFVAIKGKNFDGHKFIDKAIKKGAVAVVTKKNLVNSKVPVFKVLDTVKALGDIAAFYRKKFNVEVICITGSAGKTSTKELLSHILSSKYKVLKTQNNENNLIGVPLTLFGLKHKHDIAVVEIGTNMFGEIKRLTQICSPEIGIITNIGESHLLGLKNKKNVLKEKRALVDGLSKCGLALLNIDDLALSTIKAKAKIVYYSDVAKTIAKFFNISNANFVKVLKKYKSPLKDRFSIIQTKKFTLINDTYNSNPVSFRYAIDKLSKLNKKSKRVIIASDMLELGKESKKLHYTLGKYINPSKIDRVIIVGKDAEDILRGAKVSGFNGQKLFYFKDKTALKRSLKGILAKDDIILVKGSRLMAMEEVVNYINKI